MGQPSRATADALATEYVWLIEVVVRKMSDTAPPWMDRDDMRSAAAVALVRCSRRYDPDVGATFYTYASHRMQGAIRDSWRDNDTLSRRALKKGATRPTFVSTHRVDQTERCSIPAQDDEVVDLLTLVGLVDALDARHRLVVVESYMHDRTLRDIAGQLHVTEARVSQIRTEAINTMRSQAAA